MRPLVVIFSVLLVFSLGRLTQARTVRFEFKDALLRDSVQFTSEAPLEKIVGLNNAVGGWVELDPESLSSSFKGELELDVRTFETGSALRNDYLRDKFLGAAEFPTATFTVTKLANVSKPRLVDQQPVAARVEGVLKLKGVSRPQALLVKLTYFKQSDLTRQRLNGNLLRVSTSFDLDLSLFNIVIPESIKFRLARFLQVGADLVGTDGPVPVLIPLAEALKATKP